MHEPPHEHRRGDFSKYSDIRDLTADPVLRFQHKFYGPLALFFGLFVPAAICGIWLDDWRGGWFYAAFLKAVIVQHSTFCINSLAHVWGEWTFSDQRTPRDNVLIAFITFGEGFHNFHHEFLQVTRVLPNCIPQFAPFARTATSFWAEVFLVHEHKCLGLLEIKEVARLHCETL